MAGVVFQEATQEQVRRYCYDIWLTEYRGNFRYHTFDVQQAWADGIRAWWAGQRSPLIDILGPVKEALRWFWDNILKPPLEALFAGLGWIADRARDAFAVLLVPITATLAWIWDKVSGLGNWIWQQVQAGLSWVWDKINAGLNVISGALDWIWSQVKAGLEWVYQSTAALMSTISEYIVAGLKGIFEGFKAVGEWIFEGLKKLIIDPLVAMLRAAYDALVQVGESIRGMIMASPPTHSPIAIEGTTKRVLSVLGGAFGAWGLSEVGIHLVNAGHPMKNLELRQTRDQIMHYAGFHAMISAFQGTWMRVTVERPLSYEMNALFTPEIPGMSDLVRFEVREVWRPEFRAEQLEEPPSEDFLKYARYQGFEKFHAESYWAAHWDLPSVGQAYEMYHRLRPGRVAPELVFEEEDLMSLLRRQDVLARYRKQLIAIAFDPPTRLEIRQMLGEGVIDQKEAEQLYLDRGSDPKWAPMFAEYAARAAQSDPYRARFVSSALTMYKEGYWSWDTFSSRLSEEGVPQRMIDSIRKLADMEYTIDYYSSLLALYRDQLRKEKISIDEYARAVNAIVVVAERAAILVESERARMKLEE